MSTLKVPGAHLSYEESGDGPLLVLIPARIAQRDTSNWRLLAHPTPAQSSTLAEKKRYGTLLCWLLRSSVQKISSYVTLIVDTYSYAVQMSSIERLSFRSVYLSVIDKLSLSPQFYS
jgi:hypothetical protein